MTPGARLRMATCKRGSAKGRLVLANISPHTEGNRDRMILSATSGATTGSAACKTMRSWRAVRL